MAGTKKQWEIYLETEREKNGRIVRKEGTYHADRRKEYLQSTLSRCQREKEKILIVKINNVVTWRDGDKHNIWETPQDDQEQDNNPTSKSIF